MSILNVLGLKAVGLKRHLPIASFATWFFGKSRHQTALHKKPVYLFLMTTLSLSLLYGSMKDAAFIKPIESLFIEVSTPVLGKIQGALKSTDNLFEPFRSKESLQEEIAKLRAQNQNLLQTHLHMQQVLFKQNAAIKTLTLRESLENTPLFEKPFFQLVTLNAPSTHQPLFLELSPHHTTEVGFSVLGNKGLLGRVVHVGFSKAKVLTIFHPTSRIPVDINGVQAVAAGQGTNILKLLHIKDSRHMLREGDPVFTSGFGEAFPKGLPLGHIHSITKEAILITPLETGEATHVVNIMEHSNPEED